MRFVFDAVFIDKNGKVVYLITQMQPWKVSPYIGKAKKVLELSSGIITEKNIQIGDTLEFVD